MKSEQVQAEIDWAKEEGKLSLAELPEAQGRRAAQKWVAVNGDHGGSPNQKMTTVDSSPFL